MLYKHYCRQSTRRLLETHTRPCLQCWVSLGQKGPHMSFWSQARDVQQSPWALLLFAQPATAVAGSSWGTAGFVTVTCSLPWQLKKVCHGSQMYWLSVSSGVSFLFWEFPIGEAPLLLGAEIRTQPLGLSTVEEGFGKDFFFFSYLGKVSLILWITEWQVKLQYLPYGWIFHRGVCMCA